MMVRALVPTLVYLATFAANIPVIFVTLRSRRFENDSVAKVIASLAISDIGIGVMAACCAGVAWSLQPAEQPPEWLTRLINSGMYTFGVCSIWHLAAVSVVKCTVIVRPLTHFTIFTDRALRAIISAIWILSLVVGAANNVGVRETYFSRMNVIVLVRRRNAVFVSTFLAINFVAATLIIMTSYSKVFLVVRRQVKAMPADVLGSFGSRTIFGSSVRSAKNLFVIHVSGELVNGINEETSVDLHLAARCLTAHGTDDVSPQETSLELVLMDHNSDQEPVRDMCCLLFDSSAGVVKSGVVGERGDTTRRGAASRVVGLSLISCDQRVPLHRTSLVRQT